MSAELEKKISLPKELLVKKSIGSDCSDKGAPPKVPEDTKTSSETDNEQIAQDCKDSNESTENVVEKESEESVAEVVVKEEEQDEKKETPADSSTSSEVDTEKQIDDDVVVKDSTEAETGEDKKEEEAVSEEPSPPLPLVFIDMPDPDNFVCALATYKLLISKLPDPKDRVLHCIISGRPTNLEQKSLTPKELRARLKAGANIGDLLKRSPTEVDNAEHSCRVLEDGAVSLARFLEQHGVKKGMYQIYNGGIAPNAPVSHRMHAREFLFDRGDLIDPKRPEGSIITSQEYYKLVQHFDDIEDPKGRAKAVLNILRRAKEKHLFRPLTDLMPNIVGKPVTLILGGPATGVMKLIKDATYGTTFLRQIHSLHGMFGAWDNAKPGSFNLFPNQFNIAADIEAAQDLLIRQKLDFPMFLVPTETCKDKRLSVTPEKLRDVFKDVKMDSDMIVNMYQLWFDIQGRRPFFIFDMAPVLSASAKHSNIYSMLRIKAMYDMGVVRLREIDEDMPIDPSNKRRMASKCLTDDSIKLYYQALADVFTSSSCEENSSSSSSDISSDVKDTAPEETTELKNSTSTDEASS